MDGLIIVGARMCVCAHGSKGQLAGVYSRHCMGSEARTLFNRLGSKCPYLLSQLTGLHAFKMAGGEGGDKGISV